MAGVEGEGGRVEGEGGRVQGGPRVPQGGGGGSLVCKIMDFGKGENGPYLANQYCVS